jgi:lysophospholipase L1-like esterase
MPYTDAATSPGILYFYKIVGVDSSGSRVYVPPAGLGNVSVSTSTSLVVSAVRPGDIMNIVFGGDSITYGATLPSPSTEAPPVLASQCLESINGIRAVYFSNQGYGGTTTTDFLPSTQKVFPALISAATKLQAANPTGQLVFSLMLGTNDSASTTVNGPAPSLAHFEANYDAIVDQLLSTFPSAKIVIHYPPLYSPNTHNGANYEEAGLARLFEYQHGIDQVVAHESRLHRGHVFAGDKTAPTYFASVYQSELTAEQGQNGTFYLHPNQKGAADLGRLWAIAIYNATVGANAHR